MPESVGIATGFLIACLHRAGLATPSPTPPRRWASWASSAAARSTNAPYVLLVTGYPAADARTPAAARVKKPPGEVASWL